MSPPTIGRRGFLAAGGAAGAAVLSTRAGQALARAQPADAAALGRELAVPPEVRAAPHDSWTPKRAAAARALATAGGGVVREHWIVAEPVHWEIVPTHFDAMMDRRIPGRSAFTALAYRAYAPGFRRPLAPAAVPGPLLEAQTGDVLVVHFRNRGPGPVTMHPHGVFYGEADDGSYRGRYTTAGGFVRPGHGYSYVWQARPGTEGAWFYHDHGPLDPLPVFKGLFGPLIVRPRGTAPPDREFFLAFHSFEPLATHLVNTFSCINGHAYAGNTPTLRARVGETVAFHVYGMDDDFHVFHPHGHRWIDPDGGEVIDSAVLGPGKVISAQWTEDNPGRWFYHCHVFTHQQMGMNGWYLVAP